MRLAWLTDIHLNFLDHEARAGFVGQIAAAAVDAVLLGGDIAEAPSLCPTLRDFAGQIGIPIYFVLGNHDYYHGDLATVRAEITALAAAISNLHYLPGTPALELTPSAGLIGVGGWGDGRLGDFAGSRVMLNDYLLIRDLARLSSVALQRELGALGDHEAELLREVLSPAASRFDNLFVLTHVPPFREACWYGGAVSNEQWLPHFTCKAVGDLLLEVATAHPSCQIEVRCGHTHGDGRVELAPNLRVVTGGANYGKPVIQEIIEL